MNDRELGIQTLQLWYQQSSIQYHLTFQQVLDFYDGKWPHALEAIGSAVRIADESQDKIKAALSTVHPDSSDPNADPNVLPHYTAFGFAIAGQVVGDSGFTWYHVSQALEAGVKQTASTVGTVAAVGAAGYLTYLALAAGVGLLIMLKGARQ